MAGRVCGDFKEGLEEVVQHLLEVIQQALSLVHIVQPRNLQPYIRLGDIYLSTVLAQMLNSARYFQGTHNPEKYT